jgi:hypothetical protein
MRARHTRLVGLAGLSATLVLASCKRRPPAPARGLGVSAQPSASADAPSPPPSPRCRALDGAGIRLTLGAHAPAPPPSADEGEGEGDDDVALPFSPEIGVGVAFDGGFAVSALVPDKKTTNAVLAILSPRLPAGKTIDLLKVHGDVSPPRVAAAGSSLILAIPDGAPNGTLVRLARVDDPTGKGHVTWGADLPQGTDESEALALEVGAKAAVVAWDEWSPHAGVEIVQSSTFSPSDVTKVSPPSTLSSAEEDAEGPLLAPRTGGFWVAWIARAKRAAHKDEPAPSDTTEPVDTGPRWIMLTPLDESGKPGGTAIRVTPKDGHVQGFDIAPATDGGALVAFRDDATVEGTSGGTVRLVVVRADGAIDARTVSDEDVGPAVPSLLVDANARGQGLGWLSLTNDSGSARLVALDGQGRALDSLAAEPSAGTATLLAAHAGQILATRPRGRGVEGFVLACEKGPQAP